MSEVREFCKYFEFFLQIIVKHYRLSAIDHNIQNYIRNLIISEMSEFCKYFEFF